MGDSPTPPRRKPGRPKRGALMKKFTVVLPSALHDLAMDHPEGFSGLVRRLLTEELLPPPQRKKPRPHL